MQQVNGQPHSTVSTSESGRGITKTVTSAARLSCCGTAMRPCHREDPVFRGCHRTEPALTRAPGN
jgi:hypothetical protein